MAVDDEASADGAVSGAPRAHVAAEVSVHERGAVRLALHVRAPCRAHASRKRAREGAVSGAREAGRGRGEVYKLVRDLEISLPEIGQQRQRQGVSRLVEQSPGPQHKKDKEAEKDKDKDKEKKERRPERRGDQGGGGDERQKKQRRTERRGEAGSDEADEAEDEEACTWVQCERCAKWRRIELPSGLDEAAALEVLSRTLDLREHTFASTRTDAAASPRRPLDLRAHGPMRRHASAHHGALQVLTTAPPPPPPSPLFTGALRALGL
jgi:hypothetical protein